MRTKTTSSVTFLLGMFLIAANGSATHAGIINLMDVRATPATYGSSSMDPITGRFYTRSDGWSNSTQVTEYGNAAAYASNSGSALPNSTGGIYGTYFAVNNGKVFGRGGAWNSTNIHRWDAATGALEGTTTIAGIGGTGWFNWGGRSALNVMQDQTGMYVVGKQSSGNLWQVTKFDSSFTTFETKTFAQTQASNYGYGFMVNGNLFVGTSYDSNDITTQFDFASGPASTVAHEFDLAGNTYLSNMFYDPNADTLYAHQRENGRIYSAANISDTLGIAAVPEPGSLALIPFLGLSCTVRRRRKPLSA